MKETIDILNAEAKSLRYPDYKPLVKLNQAKKDSNIEQLKEYIKEVTDPEEKGQIYGTLGFVGFICKKDQSQYILDQLEFEKNKKTIAAALVSMTGKQVPIINNYKRLVEYYSYKDTDIRHSAISATVLCSLDWILAEKELIRHYDGTSNKWDKFWCIVAFEEAGTKACLPTLRKAINDITDGDGVNYILMASNRIDPVSMTDFYLDILISRKDTFTKGLAMKGLYLGKDITALESVLERAKNILKKKTSTPDIDHLDGYSEIQAAIMYLKLFEKHDERLPDFFDWIKNKKVDYVDYQTQKWIKKNF